MQKIMIKFLMWFLIATIALPAIILTSPISARAATKSTSKLAPVTELTTLPKHPNEDGWFNQVAMIKLKPSEGGKTYFQWNSTEGAWAEYGGSFHAWKGTNTLYYYSVSDEGEREMIQSQVIKMDYSRPKSPAVQVVSTESQVLISWEKRNDVASLRIDKDGNNFVTASAQTGYYLDQDVKVSKTYLYKMKAISQAGLKSKGVKKSVIVSTAPMPGIINPNRPLIGEGATISVASQTVLEIVSAKQEKIEPKAETPAIVTPETPPIKNWSRLFIALSILIIAAGAAIAGYYGYEWWASRRENGEEAKEKKTNNRW